VAAERLVPVLGSTAADPTATVTVLMARDPDDESYDILRGFEQRWAVLVVRLLEPVTNPAAAIRDARSRAHAESPWPRSPMRSELHTKPYTRGTATKSAAAREKTSQMNKGTRI
jgi:hypothetical protein